MLMYDADGHMSVQIMKVPHPKVAAGDDSKVTPEEKQALYDAYVAYFGTYRVDAEQRRRHPSRRGRPRGRLHRQQTKSGPYDLHGDTLDPRTALESGWDANGSGVRVVQARHRGQL